MESWDDIREWRRSVRSQLRLKRRALPRGDKETVRQKVYDLMREQFPELRFACLGFYWPFQGEIEEFWSWRPRITLTRGVWNIPVPSNRNPVQPTVLLVPLLGFDAAGYRLGHGGGYYDRTLATVAQKPLTIGIGYELGRLQTIYPQPHDIPMDAIVTESGVLRFRRRDGLCAV
jgi:5-formyltetrahydrofolate cyclo-ligase